MICKEEPRCPGCGSFMELLDEEPSYPRLRCSNTLCQGNSFLFPYSEGPLTTVEAVLRDWRIAHNEREQARSIHGV